VSKKKLRVGIVGCGTIGSILAKACKSDLKNRVKLSGLCDIDESRAAALKKKLRLDAPIVSLEKLIKRSDLVVEAASGKIASFVAKKAISAGKDVMAMSVGGLLGNNKLFGIAEKKGCKIYLPSGAICGLDGVKSAASGNIRSASITTRKPPKGLMGAPYIKKKRINLNAIKSDKVIFQGSANEAIKAFPKNINVSAALSTAGIGAKKTQVKIIVSPGCKSNIHEIRLNGDFGTIYTRCENVPSKENPKTSALAALSAVATLKGITTGLKVGT